MKKLILHTYTYIVHNYFTFSMFYTYVYGITLKKAKKSKKNIEMLENKPRRQKLPKSLY